MRPNKENQVLNTPGCIVEIHFISEITCAYSDLRTQHKISDMLYHDLIQTSRAWWNMSSRVPKKKLPGNGDIKDTPKRASLTAFVRSVWKYPSAHHLDCPSEISLYAECIGTEWITRSQNRNNDASNGNERCRKRARIDATRAGLEIAVQAAVPRKIAEHLNCDAHFLLTCNLGDAKFNSRLRTATLNESPSQISTVVQHRHPQRGQKSVRRSQRHKNEDSLFERCTA